jgi:hypothetical protein
LRARRRVRFEHPLGKFDLDLPPGHTFTEDAEQVFIRWQDCTFTIRLDRVWNLRVEADYEDGTKKGER